MCIFAGVRVEWGGTVTFDCSLRTPWVPGLESGIVTRNFSIKLFYVADPKLENIFSDYRTEYIYPSPSRLSPTPGGCHQPPAIRCWQSSMAGDTQDPLTPNEWCIPPRGAGIYSLLGLKQRSVFKGNRVALKNFTPEYK